MVSINTNLSSLIVQNNLTKSTNALNTAIERMTTGFKINSASDNAANYSISQNMVTQLSAYDVATDNIAMGIDMVNTAQDSIALMQQHGQRIHDLITQAQNGTYGEESLRAINAEVQSRIQEIDRIYANTEYNGINILEGVQLPDWANELNTLLNNTTAEAAGLSEGVDLTPKYNGFIEDAHHIEDSEVNALTHVAGLSSFSNGTTYAVSTVEDLANLAALVNAGKSGAGCTFVMGADIDVSQWCAEHMDSDGYGGWNPIGWYDEDEDEEYSFEGTFDGNGHKISGVKINRSDTDFQGVFGIVVTGELKNIGIINADINGNQDTGGLAGWANGAITNSYVAGNVSGKGEYTGGLVGEAGGNVTNCYATGNVTGEGDCTGGLAGGTYGTVTNSYVTCNVTGTGNYLGGLAGYVFYKQVSNCYATGTVSGTGNYLGGLAGYVHGDIMNSYATGNVTGSQDTGGLIGYIEGALINSYATGIVTGKSNNTGGLLGYAHGNITNSYATGDVTGESDSVGGLAGGVNGEILHSFATGNVIGKGISTGGLAGYVQGDITNSYATGNVTGEDKYTGGLAGRAFRDITNSYAKGNVSGGNWTGGLVGEFNSPYYSRKLDKICSAGTVSSSTGNQTGSLIGGIVNTYYGTSFTTIDITNASALSQELDMIGFEGKSDGTPYTSGQMEEWLENITELTKPSTTIQVGINGDSSSQVTFESYVNYNLSTLLTRGAQDKGAFDVINKFISDLSERATQLGAVSNRLESALDSTTVSIENLTSSLSTIRDADIATESSNYIKQQILQQASATLLATANQSPSIALQLI